MRLQNRMKKIATEYTTLTQPKINKINNAIAHFTTSGPDTYYEAIPLQDIFDTLKEFNIVPIQEDGTNWDGFLTGQNSKTSFDVVLEEDGKRKFVENAKLTLTWYKFDDNVDENGKWKKGRYEIVVYFA